MLCRESARHLVADIGPGGLPRTGGTYTGDGWSGNYNDTATTEAASTDELSHSISWDRRTARSYHLPNLIADRELRDGSYGLRIIEVEIDCFVAAGNSLRLYCALTPTYETPDKGALAVSTCSAWTNPNEQFEGGTEGTVSTIPAGGGRQTIRMWLATKTPPGSPWAQWKCRNGGAIAAQQTMLYEGHLWVGWRSSNSSNAIISINAWEVPEPWAPPLSVTASRGYFYGTRFDWNTASTVGDDEFVGAIRDSFSTSGGAGPATSVGLNRSGVGGKFCGEFTKSNLSYANTVLSWVSTRDATIHVVLVPKNTPASGYVPVCEFLTTIGPPAYPAAGGFGIRSQGNQYGFWADNPSTGFLGSTLEVGKAYILTGVVDGTDIYWYVNGVYVSTTARPGVVTTFHSGPFTGFHTDVIADVPSVVGDFDLYEYVYYRHAQTLDERVFTIEYLNRRYGVF